MVESEKLVLKLTPLLRSLAKSMVSGSRANLPEAVAGKTTHAPWQGLNPDHHWHSASFGVLSAAFEDSQFVMKTKFDGIRRGKDGSIMGVTAKQKLIWKKKEDQWQLVEWAPMSFETDSSAQPLFEEVLETALPDPVARQRARQSFHGEILTNSLAGTKSSVPNYHFPIPPDIESTYSYPTVSVVDFDGDGKDDLFVSARWAPPQLLRNCGDGTFEDVTAKSGLNPKNCVNFALFADFDNDGDPDALLGRTFEPTLYYQNDGGVFRDVTNSLSDLGRQFYVSSAAVTDVNRDGLLDIYLSTYNSSDGDNIPNWREAYLPPAEAEKLDKLQSSAHRFLNYRGIPNILLMNRGGGRLERAGGEVVELWRKSYQPCWFDADGDGDDDLYVCNDFAPDSFLRNDTPRGAADPVFVDAFAETFPGGELAFGMGASAGDYDNDGDLDLFVSNMYSKAGNRIISMIGNVDPRFSVAARGNFLYRNDGGVFRQVAKAGAPETKTGWSFGGQFADFNNDGWLDLYIPCGLYTAPKSVATEVDL